MPEAPIHINFLLEHVAFKRRRLSCIPNSLLSLCCRTRCALVRFQGVWRATRLLVDVGAAQSTSALSCTVLDADESEVNKHPVSVADQRVAIEACGVSPVGKQCNAGFFF